MPAELPFSTVHRDLPQPNDVARQHSAKLVMHLRELIEQHGAMPFSDYMEQVLYAPGLGYYSAGSFKLGEQGDFVTAPEMSPLFAQCLAQSLIPVLTASTPPRILEFGAGSGILAKECINALLAEGVQLEHYYILERSADLRMRQQQILHECGAKVTWLDTLPEQFSGVIIANEVLDALPVHYVGVQGGQSIEAYVDWQDDRFCWRAGALTDPRLQQRLDTIQTLVGQPLPDGYVTEINLVAEDWVTELAKMLQQGVMLFSDYGFPRHEYYHPQRHMGTLMCHYRHQAHDDVFWYPGLQDITAHVDFTAIAEAGANAGLDVMGYTSQANFLLGSGLMDIVQSCTDEQQQVRYMSQVKQLTLPQEMGELFKVICLGKGMDMTLPGFSLRDLLQTL